MKNPRLRNPRKQPPAQPIGYIDASGKRHLGIAAVQAFHGEADRTSLLVAEKSPATVPAGCSAVTPGQALDGKSDAIFLEGPKAVYCVDKASSDWFHHVLMPRAGHKATIIGKLEAA